MWQDIATCPKDGSYFLVSSPGWASCDVATWELLDRDDPASGYLAQAFHTAFPVTGEPTLWAPQASASRHKRTGYIVDGEGWKCYRIRVFGGGNERLGDICTATSDSAWRPRGRGSRPLETVETQQDCGSKGVEELVRHASRVLPRRFRPHPARYVIRSTALARYRRAEATSPPVGP
jgi:hypothetical protein